MNNDIEQLQHELSKRIGERDLIVRNTKEVSVELKQIKKRKEDIEKALTIVQAVGQLTQKELEYHISEIVTLALESVFPRPYKFVLQFVVRRNRTEADLLLEDEDGNQVSPIDSTGGGVVDVAAFALRVAMWSLCKPRLRNTIIMDEPFRFLSSDLQERAAEMLRQVSKNLNLQFLIVTHEELLLSAANKVFRVENRKGKSYVKEDN